MKNRLAFRLYRWTVKFDRFAWRMWQWSEGLQARAYDKWMFGGRVMNLQDMRDALKGQSRADEAIFWFCMFWNSGPDNSDLYRIMCETGYDPHFYALRKQYGSEKYLAPERPILKSSTATSCFASDGKDRSDRCASIRFVRSGSARSKKTTW